LVCLPEGKPFTNCFAENGGSVAGAIEPKVSRAHRRILAAINADWDGKDFPKPDFSE